MTNYLINLIVSKLIVLNSLTDFFTFAPVIHLDEPFGYYLDNIMGKIYDWKTFNLLITRFSFTLNSSLFPCAFLHKSLCDFLIGNSFFCESSECCFIKLDVVLSITWLIKFVKQTHLSNCWFKRPIWVFCWILFGIPNLAKPICI